MCNEHTHQTRIRTIWKVFYLVWSVPIFHSRLCPPGLIPSENLKTILAILSKFRLTCGDPNKLTVKFSNFIWCLSASKNKK